MFRLTPLLILAVLACEFEGESPVAPAGYETPVELDVFPETSTFCEGDMRRFTVQVAWLSEDPPPMVPPDVSWSSSDPTVLTIGEDGVARSHGPGTAEVRGMVEWPGVVVWKTADVEVLPGIVAYEGGRELRPGVFIGGERKCVVGGLER